jgi:hypothetical protein
MSTSSGVWRGCFAAPGGGIERSMYGWSVTHCLPTQLAERRSAALGTVMRAETLRQLVGEAGLASVEVLPVANGLFRLYRLDPYVPNQEEPPCTASPPCAHADDPDARCSPAS